MTIIQGVQAYLEQCPLLRGGRVNVDFLAPDAMSYSIVSTPVQPIVKKYLNGDTVRNFAFSLDVRSQYGEFILQQVENIGLLEQITNWLEAKSRKREFPALGDGRTVRKIEVTSSGYSLAQEGETAQYRVQCSMTYEQKGGR